MASTTSDWSPGGNARRRRKIAAWVLDRDGRVCRWCGKEATTVDHLTARADGGTDDLQNLAAACLACNSSRGAAIANRKPVPSRRW